MAAKKLRKGNGKAIRDARSLIGAIERRDANEAETRRRVERIFENVMGYDALTHLSRERAVHGAGDTEHVDFAIQIDERPDAPPEIMVELKRVGVNLTSRHLKQASRYAIDAGCEWVLLTNAREWQLFHVEFGQPPVTKLVERWNLLEDEADVVAKKFALISLKSLKRGVLGSLWETTQVLAAESLLKAILSRDSIRALRRVLWRETGVRVKADQIVSGLRKMLNEAAAAVLENVEVSLPPARKQRRRRGKYRPRCTLKAIVEAGLIAPGSLAFVDYGGARYEAVVQSDGTMLFEGKSYKSPSAAGGAVTARHNVAKPNGWTFWHITDATGEAKSLAVLRRRYKATTAGGAVESSNDQPD